MTAFCLHCCHVPYRQLGLPCATQTLPQPVKVDRTALPLPQDLSASPADFRLTNSNAERVTKLQHMLEIGDIA